MSPSVSQASKGRRLTLSFLKILALTAAATLTLKPQWLASTDLASRTTFEQAFDPIDSEMANFTQHENATLEPARRVTTNNSAEMQQHDSQLKSHASSLSQNVTSEAHNGDGKHGDSSFERVYQIATNGSSEMPQRDNTSHAAEFGQNINKNEGKWHHVLGVVAPVALNVADIDRIVARSINNSSNISFCVEWDFKDADYWWAHHIDWEVFHEDDTHFCFQKIMNEKKRDLFLRIYENQFRGNCSNMTSQQMINSGWAASMSVVSNGLIDAMTRGQPVQTEIQPWIYAVGNRKDSSPPVCDSKDMYCFFLPTSGCPRREGHDKGLGYVRGARLCCHGEYPWYLEFASRPQSWLRKRTYDFVKHQMASMTNFRTPCTIFHVRRADATMDKNNRGFRSIAEYLNATDKTEDNVLLLTDDHHAIGEALHGFPDAKNWMYLNRTRHRGTEGGWQPFNPSGDLAHEMAVIMGTFRIAERCSSIINTNGGFASFLYGSTLKRHKDSWMVQLKGLKGEAVKSSVNVSKAYG